MKKIVLVLGVAALLFASCGSSPSSTNASKEPDLTGVTSYYVRANGNDRNTGISEDMPFKTLARAVTAALSTNVKKITVIGKLDGTTTIKNTVKPTLSAVVDRPVTETVVGGQKIVSVDMTKPAFAQIKGSYNEPDPNEILITGKPDASGNEKAVLTNSRNADNILRIESAAVRLENIEVSGFASTNPDSRCIRVWTGVLILGKDAKITSNKVIGVHAIDGGVIIMRDNAEVSNNQSDRGNTGVYLETGSVMVMLDNTVIKENKALGYSGGGVAITAGTLIMRGNSAISNNSSANFGGGIIVFDSDGLIEMYDNATVTGNNTAVSGGVLLFGVLRMNDTSKITDNTASGNGGGVFVEGAASIYKAATAVLANNKAPRYPDTNFNLR